MVPKHALWRCTTYTDYKTVSTTLRPEPFVTQHEIYKMCFNLICSFLNQF
jgi:hypothetical protein